MDNCRYQLKTQRHSSHSQIFRLLKQASAASKILEVGIASGYLGRYLCAQNFEITGIEKDNDLAKQAKPYYHQIFILDLNREEIPALRPFDFIIFADILEHLYDPLRLLKRIYSLLKDDGRIIVSIPNVANWVIRLRLALGNFDYADRGILDKGHLRFFTLKTAKKLIQEANFRIFSCDVTSIPFQLLLKPNWLSGCANELYYPLAKIYPKIFAYQFVFTAAKLKSDSN